MGHKMLIFKFFLLILFLSTNALSKQIVIGKATIIDGDTINIDSNKIRLYGIDAPEKKQNCLFSKKKWPCGKQSTKELKNLINNQIIECHVNDIDIYNRYIAICFNSELNINRIMVKKGWAVAYRYYSIEYIMEEKYARENKLGIWKGKFQEPYLYRKQNK